VKSGPPSLTSLPGPWDLALLLWGSYWGLLVAPAEAYMGGRAVQSRYVHVATPWNANALALTFASRCALLSL